MHSPLWIELLKTAEILYLSISTITLPLTAREQKTLRPDLWLAPKCPIRNDRSMARKVKRLRMLISFRSTALQAIRTYLKLLSQTSANPVPEISKVARKSFRARCRKFQSTCSVWRVQKDRADDWSSISTGVTHIWWQWSKWYHLRHLWRKHQRTCFASAGMRETSSFNR